MGVIWYADGKQYQDCDHCGLSFRTDGHLRADHETGNCVNVFGDKEGKQKTYGADKQADTRHTRSEEQHSPSGVIVASPLAPSSAGKVETGFA